MRGRPQRNQGQTTTPPALSPAGQEGRTATPRGSPSPGWLERNAMLPCFQLTSPPAASAFLRPGVKTATGRHRESWEGWRELLLVAGPGEPSPHLEDIPPPSSLPAPPSPSQGLALTSWPLHRLLELRKGRGPHIPRECPRGLWEGSQPGRGQGIDRPVPLGFTPASTSK